MKSKLVRRDDGVAEVRQRSRVLPAILAAASLFLLGRIVWLELGWTQPQHGQSMTKEIIGCLAGAAMFGLCAVVFFEDNSFEFDLAKRMVNWRRRSLFRTQSGSTPFADVEQVVVEPMTMGSSGGRATHRLSLICKEANIPFSKAYDGGDPKQKESLAVEIRELLGLTPSARPTDDRIITLVRAGQKIEAIKLAREVFQLSLVDAKTFVEAIENDSA